MSRLVHLVPVDECVPILLIDHLAERGSIRKGAPFREPNSPHDEEGFRLSGSERRIVVPTDFSVYCRCSASGPPPRPPADLNRRSLPIYTAAVGTLLYRIHRTGLGPLYFGRQSDPARRQRWGPPDASYGVCYLAFESHISFAETMLRDLRVDTVQQSDLSARSLAFVEVRKPPRLVNMSNEHLRALGADASVVQGAYAVASERSAALHAHPNRPDGIRYRARHDDSGFSVALFERAARKVRCIASIPVSDPSLANELARWLDRYRIGLTT